MSTYYLFLDTETGGLDAKNNSLLTASFLITDKDGNDKCSLDLYLRPDDGIYHLTPTAIEINGLNIADQSGVVAYSEGYRRLESFLAAFRATVESVDYIVPVGWNLPFDLDFIYNQLVPKQTLQAWLNSYKMIDLASVWLYLKAAGKVDSRRDRLIDAVQILFNYDHTFEAHNATNDMVMTRNVFFKLKELL